MRTFEGKYIRVHYNTDLSGTITIERKSSGQKFPFKASDLVDWFVEVMRDRQIEQVEHASPAEILRGGL